MSVGNVHANPPSHGYLLLHILTEGLPGNLIAKLGARPEGVPRPLNRIL